MSEVKWTEQQTGQVSFSDDAPKTSEALNQELPASEYLQSRIEVKAATLSGQTVSPDQAERPDHPRGLRSSNSVDNSGAKHHFSVRTPVNAASRNVSVAPRSDSVYQASDPQSTSSDTNSEGPSPTPLTNSSSILPSGLTKRLSRLTYAGPHHKGRNGALQRAASSAAEAAGDDPCAQGIRGTVMAATAVNDAVRFGAWTWKKSLSILRKAGDFVSLVRTQGLTKAVGSVIRAMISALVSGVASVVGAIASLLAVIVILLAILATIFGIGTDMSFGVSGNTLEELYAYCTEKDAALTVQIREQLNLTGYSQVQLFYNGALIEPASDFSINTDIDRLLLYLQAANSSGTHTVDDLEAQIDDIYNAIYGIETEEVRSTGSPIAEAAVMVASKMPPEQRGWQLPENDGTPLYRAVHDLTQSNSLYQSCDRVACAIIRWSGADDNFPTGLDRMVNTYLRDDGQGTGKDHWMKLPDDWTRDDLLPGDVLIWKNHAHVFIYVGHDLIEAQWPDLTDPDYCVVEGSYTTSFAAACNKWQSIDNNSFVYRNIKPEEDPKYIDGIPGITPGKNTLNVQVTAQSLSQWISDNTDVAMREHISLMTEFGSYAGYASGSNPLGAGQRWTVTERFGSYADGTSITERNYATVWTGPGREIFSPLDGTLSWSGNTATISSTSSTGSLHQISITGLSPSIAASTIRAGAQIGSTVSDSIAISYSIDGSHVNPAIYLTNEPGSGSEAIVDVALTQLGQQGGAPYWSWYGFDSRTAWCACFVSWCADQCGLLSSGLIPKYAECSVGAAWFQQNGQWARQGYAPSPGDIIFFINNGDTVSHHTGIVMACDGSTVQTIEGNSGDAVRIRSYSINSTYILGYGLPAYS